MGRIARVVGTAGLAVGVLVSCSGGEKNKAPDRQSKDLVGAKEICDGIFSPTAVRALQTIAGVKEFQPSNVGDGLEGSVKEIVEEYDPSGVSPRAHDVDLCLVYKPTSGGISDIEITFSLSDAKEAARGGEDPSFVKFPVGLKALAHAKVSVLYTECVSSKMPGSESSPAVLRGELRNRNEPEGSAERLREANLTVLNSAALRLAKELGCEKNAGLSEKPNLRPLP